MYYITGNTSKQKYYKSSTQNAPVLRNNQYRTRARAHTHTPLLCTYKDDQKDGGERESCHGLANQCQFRSATFTFIPAANYKILHVPCSLLPNIHTIFVWPINFTTLQKDTRRFCTSPRLRALTFWRNRVRDTSMITTREPSHPATTLPRIISVVLNYAESQSKKGSEANNNSTEKIISSDRMFQHCYAYECLCIQTQTHAHTPQKFECYVQTTWEINVQRSSELKQQ